MRGAPNVSLRASTLAGLILILGAGRVLAQQPDATQASKPATADSKRASIYDKTADASAELAKAALKAKHDDKRILVMFGGDWCGWCHKLHGLFKTDSEVAKIISYEYVLLPVDVEAPNGAALLATCKAALSETELKKGVGYPFLAVFDADGKIVTAQRTDPLEEGDHHDPKKVAGFLNQWKVTPKDAKLVVSDALARASSNDKHVLLTFGAPWCGWCHELHNWLAQPEIAAIVDRDFVVTQVDIDRMTAGKEVMSGYRPSAKGSIPWFAILDAKGNTLATSDGPKGNIGYPAQPDEIAHFMAMIKGHVNRIDASQLDQLKTSLEANSERIMKRLRH
jgi:thioredoxin-related protein